MTKKINTYLEQIPEDFELLLKGLGHGLRLSIATLLLNHEELSLSKIVNKLGKENSLILNHISKLEIAGVVQNFIKKKENTREYSFYELTEYGRLIFKKLIDSYNDYFKSLNDKASQLNIKQSDEIPEDFEAALNSLSNKFRLALTLLFMEIGAKSFSELVVLTGKNKSAINHHLAKLESSGVVQNQLQKSEDSAEYSFYKITQFGKTIVSSLINSYNEFYKPLEQLANDEAPSGLNEQSNPKENPLIKFGCNS